MTPVPLLLPARLICVLGLGLDFGLSFRRGTAVLLEGMGAGD